MVIAYLRYVPDPRGERVREGIPYRRVENLKETTELLQAKFPYYLNYVQNLGLRLQSVPLIHIARIFKPQEKLQEIIKSPNNLLEEIYIKFVSALSSESKVALTDFGISGSVLIGLSRDSSDVDVIVYGQNQGNKVYRALKRIRSIGSWIEPYTSETVVKVLTQRWGGTCIDIEKLREIEIQKVLHGRVDGRDYFIRLLREYNDLLPSIPIEKVIIRGKISDSSCSIFTPALYEMVDIDKIPLEINIKSLELMSHRGKFTEHASKGDHVEVRGMLEEVKDPRGTLYRVVLGDDSDYMIPYI